MAIESLLASSRKIAQAVSKYEPYNNSYNGLEVPVDDLKVEEEEGFTVPYAGGQFSDFFKAEYVGKKNLPKMVSIKVWRGQNYEVEPFEKAIVQALRQWRTLDHESIVPLFGLCGPKMRAFPGIVVPHYSNGNVLTYLSNNRGASVTSILVDIMRGLSYVHAAGIVHGELKGSNVFIDDAGHARLTDFGFMNQVCDQVLSVPNTTAIYRWFAPELLAANGENGESNELGTTVTDKCDIYSFAMTAVEIFTLKQPFGHIRNHAVVILQVMNHDGRPNRPSPEEAPQLTNDMWELIEECWAREPKDRPDTKIVAQRVLMLHMMSES